MDIKNYYRNELNDKAKHMLDEYVIDGEKTGVVIINAENVSKVLAMISTDSAYRKAMDKQAPDSSAYWFNKILTSTDNNLYDCIKGAVIAIDKENSTHLNAVKAKEADMDDIRTEMTKRISREKVIESLKEYLNKSDHNDTDCDFCPEVFGLIASELKGKTNPSFASKFCHYFSKAVDEGSDEFPIYDSVLFKVIPLYANLHGNVKSTLLSFSKGCDLKASYKAYIDAVEELSINCGVSKTGLDQLLWYYYKGREIPKKKTFEYIRQIIEQNRKS